MPNEYRVTRPLSYLAGTVGHADVTARQGYYIAALSPVEAVREAIKSYEMCATTSVFDVQLWRNADGRLAHLGNACVERVVAVKL